MPKFLRVIAYLVGAFVLLLVAAVIIIPLVFNPNDYKDDIAAAAKAKTGRTLVMQGDIGLSVFPWLALKIGPTTLANAPGFSDRPLAAVKQVDVRIKLLPLLRKHIEMDTVVLDGLQLSLETNAGGKTNWDGVIPAASSEKPAPAETPSKPGVGKMALAGLAIGGVKVSDAGVLWDDRKNKARYQLTGLSLRTGAIQAGATVPVEFSMQVDSAEPAIKGVVNLGAKVALSEDSQIIQLTDARLKTDLRGAGLPGGALAAQLDLNATLDLAKGSLQVPQLTAKALGLTIDAQVQGRNLFTEPALTADVKLKEFEPKSVLKALGQPLPEMSDATVLGKADASLKLAATASSANVTELRARFDQSTLDGNLRVSHFSKPAIRFQLQLDEIDVDRYLPPHSAEAVPVTPTTAAAAGAQLFPVDTLRALDVDGDFKIGKLKAYQMQSTDIVIKLVANGGRIRVHPAQAKMYQGSYDGDLTLDVRGAQPKISMNEKLAGVQIGPLLKDITGKEILAGTTRATAVLTATGQAPEALKKSLNGNIVFAFENGSVKGFNLVGLIRNAHAVLNGQPVPADEGAKQTDFSEVSGTATVTNGVIRNRDLLAKTPFFRVDGEGEVSLPAEKLDYTVTAKVVDGLQGQGGKAFTDLQGMAIPVQISGSFAKPQYQVRLDGALKQAAEKKIKKKIEKKIEKKLEKKLGNELGDKLKGLFQ